MKTFKIILLCIIPILGIYAMNKIQFAEKLVIMLPGRAPVRGPGGPQAPPPQMEQAGPQAPPPQMEQVGPQATLEDAEREIRPDQEAEQGEPQASVAQGESVRQGPPAGPGPEEQSKWKVRINFNRGIKTIGLLTLIMASIIEFTYIADRLIRRKPLL